MQLILFFLYILFSFICFPISIFSHCSPSLRYLVVKVLKRQPVLYHSLVKIKFLALWVIHFALWSWELRWQNKAKMAGFSASFLTLALERGKQTAALVPIMTVVIRLFLV